MISGVQEEGDCGRHGALGPFGDMCLVFGVKTGRGVVSGLCRGPGVNDTHTHTYISLAGVGGAGKKPTKEH
jgi:hypothetical protein